MGIQVTGKAEVKIDGRAPKGVRERLLAWLVVWKVNREIREWKRDKGLTPGQKARRNRLEIIKNTAFRKWLNAFTTVLSVVSVPIWTFEAVVATSGWKRLLYVALTAASTYRVWVDYRTWRKLKVEEAELIVDDVHDL